MLLVCGSLNLFVFVWLAQLVCVRLARSACPAYRPHLETELVVIVMFSVTSIVGKGWIDSVQSCQLLVVEVSLDILFDQLVALMYKLIVALALDSFPSPIIVDIQRYMIVPTPL